MDPVRDQIRERMNGAKWSKFSENPIAMLLGGLAAGFLVGLIVPVSQFETQRMRPVADELKERARDAGQQAIRRGGDVLKDTIGQMSAAHSHGGLSGGAGHGLQQADQNLGPGQ